MKKLILPIFLVLFFSNAVVSQTTATDFNTSDCASVVHHLYADLDSGKVVILNFVMPCGFCVKPSQSAYNIAEQFKTNYPGRIKYFLSDGFGNNICGDLYTWAAANNIGSDAILISSHSVTMNDYGTIGMPKVVIIGGTNHLIYFNENDSLAGDSLSLYTAIDSALKSTTNISEKKIDNLQLRLFPNPLVNQAKVSYTLFEQSEIEMEIYNAMNEKIYSVKKLNEQQGKHEAEINFEKFSNGNYILMIRTNKSTSSIKFTIAR